MTKTLLLTKTTITNIDLYSYYFPMTILEKNIDSLDLQTIIKTQDLILFTKIKKNFILVDI